MEYYNKLSRWQKIQLGILWAICRCFALLPRVIRYHVFGYSIYLLLRLLRYRRKVVMTNLRNSFPEKSEKELSAICNRSYRNLAEQIINMISPAGISDKELMRRMNFVNIADICKVMDGRSAIFMMGHYGPWEPCSTLSLYLEEHTLVAVYHALHNKVFDELFRRIRNHSNIELVPMRRTMRHFIENHKKRPMIVGLISDQNPTARADMHWHKFLHQWTAFFDGGEVMARKYNLPVFYFTHKRLRAGIYEGYMTCIYDGNEQVEPHEITERYVRMLEKDINECPELWMWTHRRWKHIPPEELLKQKF